MKKIAISLGVIGVVAAIVIGATTAYFSDTETSTGNTFTAGTIDISINDQNPWEQSFSMLDMKPCYTDYITFRVNNNLSDPNPVNIFKKIIVTNEETGTVSEPECEEEGGVWENNNCVDKGSWVEINSLSSVIWYDLYVEVYNAGNEKIWWQTIYVDADEMSIDDVYGEDDVFLGMIPAGGYMLVEQSYHLSPNAGNEYQGDSMTFSIEVKGVQLYGTAWLENKEQADGGQGPWKIVTNDGIKGELTYEVKHPTFDFEFTGTAPLNNQGYVLAAGMKQTGTGYDVDTYLGEGTSDESGYIEITGDVNTGDMKNVKVWLIPSTYWDYGAQEVKWTNWPSMVSEFLWETGLIWYEDTDL